MNYVLTFIIMAVSSRFFYIQGLKDADFDRKLANTKLQQCYEVIRK